MIDKNVFGERICDPQCRAYYVSDTDGMMCEARLDRLGRVGVKDGKVVYGILCNLPIDFKVVRIGDDAEDVKKHNEYLSDVINDLTLALSMWIDEYPFDDDHKAKQRMMIDSACVLIGKPRTMEELAVMCGLDDEHVELARQHDKELKHGV